MSNSFDVLIFGTGPAGSATALALQQAGITRVGLVGRTARPEWQIGESAPPELNHLVCALGLSDDLQVLGHSPCHGNVSAWGRAVHVHDFLRNGLGNGWHLDRAAFDAWLLRAAVQRGATVINARRLEVVSRDVDRGWAVTLCRDGGPLQLSAAVIVVATGRAAASALRFQARTHRVDQLVALAAVSPINSNAFMPGYSLIEAIELGWWYSAPLPGGKRITVLMTDKNLVRKHSLLNKERFLALLSGTRLLRSFVPESSEAVDAIKTFPAATQYRDRAAGARWFAVGDALVAFDPLTSAGISGALNDARNVAGTITKILSGASAGEMRDLAFAHADRANRMLTSFLSERGRIYGQETRWPNSAFWRSRIGAIPDVGPIGPLR